MVITNHIQAYIHTYINEVINAQWTDLSSLRQLQTALTLLVYLNCTLWT